MKLFNTLTLFSLLLSIGCSKTTDNSLPNVYVSYRDALSSPKLNKLSSAGNAVLIDGYGIAGLLLYKRVTDGVIVAYDRCSTVNPDKRCAVTIDNNNVTVTDPCSQAKFNLEDGQPSKAPATLGLKRYSVYTTQFEIVVSN